MKGTAAFALRLESHPKVGSSIHINRLEHPTKSALSRTATAVTSVRFHDGFRISGFVFSTPLASLTALLRMAEERLISTVVFSCECISI